MTAALTPALALDYVRELSADIRAGVVLDARGGLLAGPEALAAPARALLAEAPAAASIEGATEHGAAYAARDARHAIVVVTGRFSLPRLTRHDLRTALSALGGEMRPIGVPAAAPATAVAVLLAASDEGFRRARAVSRSE